MSRESLQVATAHLRELAARHGQAAAEVTSATEVVSGVDSGIRTSHGVIAWSTASAVEAIQYARRDAGIAVAAESQALSDNLGAAADTYEAADAESGVHLDEQVRPR